MKNFFMAATLGCMILDVIIVLNFIRLLKRHSNNGITIMDKKIALKYSISMTVIGILIAIFGVIMQLL